MKKLLLFVIAVITGFCIKAQVVPNAPSAYSAPPSIINYPYLSDYNNISLRNYTRIYTPQLQTTDSTGITLGSSIGAPLVMTSYQDGLGRPLQEVLKTPIPNNSGDMVKVHVYDEVGREPYKYLPYVISDAVVPGRLKVNPLYGMTWFYGNLYPDDQSYSQMSFDNSPLNRPVKLMPQGNSWVGSGVGKQIDYAVNKDITSYITGSTVYDFNVLNYTIAHNDISDLPTSNGYYPEGDLMVVKETDEDGNINLSYTDKGGHTVAKMQYMQSPQNAANKYFHVTYFVYDDFDQLRFVITPQAFAATNNTGTITQSIADGLCYKYWYNAKGLLTQKKQPGVDAEYFVYDKKDRLVIRQDGALRNDGQKWAFITYDVLDRPMMTGVTSIAASQANWESFFANGVYSGYTNQDLKYFLLKYDLYNEYENSSLSNGDIYTKNYYDSYNNIENLTPSLYSWNAPSALIPSSPTVPWATPTQQTRGLLVGTRTRIMNNSSSTIDWYKAYNYFDENGKLIQRRSTPPRGTGTDVVTLQYDFAGTLVRTVVSHTDIDSANAPYTTIVVKKYNKDYNSGKITGMDQSINGSTFIPVFQDLYDDLGRVGNHSLGGADNNLDYNIRGWLTGINAYNMDVPGANNEYFHEQISYDKGFADVHLNGNISGIIWKNYGSGATKKYYGYTYDNLNRLAHADFKQWETNMPGTVPGSYLSPHWDKTLTDYTASNITYDNNGNIQSMNQRGPDGAATPAPGNIDVLKYHYSQFSNQLLSVQDSGIVSPTVPDFTDSNITGADYDYDASGNQTKDLNKNISSISYWSAYGKPLHIVVTGKGIIDYLYDGAGNKIKKTVIDNTGTTPDTTITDYDGAFVYQNNKLKYILHPEGRCRPVNTSGTPGAPNDFTYDYFIKDHIGNVRTVYNLNNVSLGTHLYSTGLEVALANTESVIWAHLGDVRTDRPFGGLGDVKAAQLDASDPSKKIGPAISIRVMPGDKFTLDAQTYYDAVGNTQESNAENTMNSLLGVLAGGVNINNTPVAELDDNMQLLQNTVGNTANTELFSQLLSAVPGSEDGPASYLGYLFFNSRNELVPEQSGLIPFGATGDEWQTINTPGQIDIGTAGTLTIFAFTNGEYPTFIDNVNLTYQAGNVIEQEEHYYPFGLSISNLAVDPYKQNNFKYTGQEYQHKEFNDGSGLELYDYIARGMDPQTGRFMQVDPLAEDAFDWTPYRYAFDNPVYFNDPTGMKEGYGDNFTISSNRSNRSGADNMDIPYLDFPYGFSYNINTFTPNSINIPKPLAIPTLKPSILYTYESGSDSKKRDDDWNYIVNGENGWWFSRWMQTISRDWDAAQNRQVVGDLDDFATVVNTMPVVAGGMRVERAAIAAAEEAAVTKFKPFNLRNYRYNLKVLTRSAGEGMDAHHIFPKAKEFARFFEKAGINVHDPHNMVWWESTAHQAAAKGYNEAWTEFFRYEPNANADQIINFARSLMGKYGF